MPIDPVERTMRERAKAMMRRHARGVRQSVPAAALEARAVLLRARLEALPVFARATSIAAFWPIERNKEVDLRPLFGALREGGKRLAFPRIVEPGAPLVFAWVDDDGVLAERGRGFAEPPPEAPLAEALDVVLVPALLVDGQGHRLGYGAGYYDRTLPRFCPPGVAVAVAFDFQLAPEVPTLEGDVAVDCVVTDARTLETRPASTKHDKGRPE